MKRLSLVIFSLLAFTFSFAQTSKISIVGKPQKSTSDIVGARDANGRFCAAIKVISDMDGFKYQSNNGVVKVDDMPGRDMVYLSPDERVLEIYHSGYEMFQMILSEYGIQLHPKEVWTVRIKGDPKTGNLLPVTIFANPSDSKITIDGKSVISGKVVEVSRGKHTLTIENEGYKTVNKTITISNNNVVFNENLSEVDLQPVQIKSVPTGAHIFIEGHNKGVTDKGLWLYPGSYSLKLSMNVYLDVLEKITVVEEKKNIFSYNLQKNRGSLFLDFFPQDSRVTINKKDYSGKSSIELLPGKYELEISKSGYLSQKETLVIERGKKYKFKYHLTKNSGSLNLNVNPYGAKVLINKEDFSERSTVELAPGRYKIEISKTGYHPQSEVITIIRGQFAQKNYNLIAKTGKLQFTIQPLNTEVKLKQNGRIVQSWTGMKYIKELPIGNYKLECRALGYNTKNRTFVIKENKAVSIEIVMEKGSDIVFVKGGTFEMGDTFGDGDEDEKPVHRVTLSDFYVGKYEVTFDEYDKFCEEMGKEKPDDSGWGRGKRPVINVSWNDAVSYCAWLSKKAGEHYRLPTEAEWEYVAKGGSTGLPTKYSGSNNVDEVAWYNRNSGSKTHSVGQKKPNELGIYDMSGNVLEWCSDWYDKNYYKNSSSTNPKGRSFGSYRVLRGGNWSNGKKYVNTAYRISGNSDNSYSHIGFRVVKTR